MGMSTARGPVSDWESRSRSTQWSDWRDESWRSGRAQATWVSLALSQDACSAAITGTRTGGNNGPCACCCDKGADRAQRGWSLSQRRADQ